MLLFSVSCAGEATTGRYIALLVLISDVNHSVNVMLISELISLAILSKTEIKIHKNKMFMKKKKKKNFTVTNKATSKAHKN